MNWGRPTARRRIAALDATTAGWNFPQIQGFS